MKPVHELPRWAREPLADYLDAAYQIRAAIVDLNRDGHPEILLAAAPPAPDLHIPKRAFSVLIESDRGWVERQSDSECQPNRFGAFRHQGWWDIRCREGLTERVLRWNGGRYGRS